MTNFDKGSGGGGASSGPNPIWVKKPAAKKPVSKGPNKVWVKKPSTSHAPVRHTAPRQPAQPQQRNYQPANRPQRRDYQPANQPQRRSYSAPPRVVAPRPPVGNTPAGTIARSVPPPAPKPTPLTPDQFLAKDTVYKGQQSAYQKALADYATNMQAETGKYNGEYDASVKQLGLGRSEGVTSLRDDYASRGMVNSGVYGDALGDLNKKFDTQQGDLDRAKQAYLSDLTTGQTNFKTTQEQLLERARQEALNRRLDGMQS